MPAPLWFLKLRAFLKRSLDEASELFTSDSSVKERTSRKIKLRQFEDRVLMSASPVGAEAGMAPEVDETQQASSTAQLG